MDGGFLLIRGCVRHCRFLTLLLYLLLMMSFHFLQKTFFQVTTCNKTCFELFEITSCGLFGFQNEFDRDDEFAFMRLFSEDEGAMVDQVLYFHADGMKPC